jgi:hypothetical protein
MFGHGSFVTLSMLAALVECVVSIAAPMITPGPVVEKRDFADNYNFIGYYSSSGASTCKMNHLRCLDYPLMQISFTSDTYSTCSGSEFDITTANTNSYGGCETSSLWSYFTTCSDDYAYGVFATYIDASGGSYMSYNSSSSW